MSQTTKCAILLEISSGAASRLPFDASSLKDDNVVAIMDELHEVIWLWMGKNTGLVMRRGSMRAARSLKAYGHEIGPSIVGRKLKDVVPVDGLKIESDPTEKAKFEKILSLFTREHEIKADVLAEYQVLAQIEQPKYYGLSKTQRDDLVAAAIAAPSAGDDTRKIEEIVGEFRPSISEQSSTATVVPKNVLKPTPPPTTTPTFSIPESPPPAPATISTTPPGPPPAPVVSPPPVVATETIEIPDDIPAATPEIPVKATPITEDDELIGEVKGAIVITSILSEYSDIFIGVKKEGNKKIFTIESQDGLIAKYALDKSKIQFLQGSWDKISADQKRRIQKLFIDRVKKLLGT
ncbi:MAG: hypothetical protein ACTSQI_01190 [Candidatus Helarchaeota archaeon]